MRDARFYDEPRGTRVDLRETHSSIVFLVGSRVFKLKKPVDLGFLDYSTPERRRLMCERECELNGALGGRLYVGVRAVVARAGRLELGPSDSPAAVEYLVEMHRYEEQATLEHAVAAGTVDAAAIEAIAATLARFHAAAPRARSARRALPSVKRMLDGNFEAVLAGWQLDTERVLRAQRFADAFVAGHSQQIAERERAGLVRAGHGDLRAEHVLLGDEPAIVDCVEFDPRLREIDVGEDLAFLVMDLERLGRPDLAAMLVKGYRDAGGDPGSDELIAFYAAAKAWVRAKIALLAPNTAAQEVASLFALGERLAWRARRPLALIVCGPPAAGKSTLAGAIAEVAALPIARSDETRKHLAGVAPTLRAPDSAYTATFTAATYRELGRRAKRDLEQHRGVIVDATFGTRAARRAFAEGFGAHDALICECVAPPAVRRTRARRRNSQQRHASDATAAVAEHLGREFAPLELDVPASHHLVVRTDQRPERVLDDLVVLLDRHLARAHDTRVCFQVGR